MSDPIRGRERQLCKRKMYRCRRDLVPRFLLMVQLAEIERHGGSAASHDDTLAWLWFGSSLLSALVRLPKHGLESLGHICIVSCADLDPCGLELRCQLLSLCLADLPLHVQIALLPDNDTGHGLGSGVVQDLVVDSLDHVEAITRGDAVDEHVAVNANGVFRIEDRVLILAGSVDDVAVVFLASVRDGLLEDVFDSGVVRVDKSVLDISDD